MMDNEMDREEMLAALYGSRNDDDAEEKREQPAQLKYAGKATVVTIDGKQVLVPRIEYIETLERTVRAFGEENEQLRQRLRKLELMYSRNSNIANTKLRTVESELKSALDRKIDRKEW